MIKSFMKICKPMKTLFSKNFISAICFLFLTLSAIAQSISIKTTKTQVAVGERFGLSIEISNYNGQFTPPQHKDLKYVGGPSRQMYSSNINGKVTSSTTFTYDCVINKKGKFTIPAASINHQGKLIQSNTAPIEVTDAPKVENNGDVIIAAIPSKRALYEGEPVEIVIKLFTKYNNVSTEDFVYPELKDGWIKEIPLNGQPRLQNDSYKGKAYYGAVLRKIVFIPQRSGDIYFDAIKAKFKVQTIVPSNNPMENFYYGGTVQERYVDVISDRVKFDVQPLPEQNKPANFQNAIGNYEFSASIDKKEVNTNDPVNLVVKISGTGNLSLVNVPDIKFPLSFEVAEPILKENVKPTEKGMNGSKTYEYLIIPRGGGDFALGPIHFSYFDPKTKKYHELKSDSLKLKVIGKAVTNTTGVAQNDVELLGSDIHYISNNTQLETPQHFIISKAYYYLLSAIPFLAILLVILLRKQLFFREIDIEKQRMKGANSVASKRLKLAKKYLSEHNKDAYFEALYKALQGYLSDKFQLSLAEMTKENIRQTLQKRNVEESIIQETIDIMEACEFARFAPASEAEQENTYNKAERLISQFEKIK